MSNVRRSFARMNYEASRKIPPNLVSERRCIHFVACACVDDWFRFEFLVFFLLWLAAARSQSDTQYIFGWSRMDSVFFQATLILYVSLSRKRNDSNHLNAQSVNNVRSTVCTQVFFIYSIRFRFLFSVTSTRLNPIKTRNRMCHFCFLLFLWLVCLFVYISICKFFFSFFFSIFILGMNEMRCTIHQLSIRLNSFLCRRERLTKFSFAKCNVTQGFVAVPTSHTFAEG